SLARIEPLTASLRGADAFAAALEEIQTLRERLEPIATDIAERCVDDPPAHLRDGGLFRDGVDEVLDRARTVRAKANSFLAEYQKKLIDDHDLPSLKVGYNRVFGYYIELPAAQSKRAPDTFTRKQTLKNAERYITPELKQFEDEVLGAGERAVARELDLFHELCDRVIALAREIGVFAGVVAELDVLLCFADRAAARSWVRPTITDEPSLHIVQGRHPVLDEISGDGFVPNDTALGTTGEDPAPRLALITGPNMAGKSTYIRQVALITLLAHTGSFVPASSATIGLTDRIFTRIGADDALHRGQSTFMVEMTETANILNNATPRSLVILDEIGRGTSTLDGLSLAWAITEYLGAGENAADSPRTLFATHYHELTDLAERLPGRVANFHVSVREWGDEIVFLHRILPGATNRSFGVHVGRLAGLPAPVIERATDLLASLSVSHDSIGDKAGAAADQGKPATRQRGPDPSGQFGLFTEYVPHPVIEEIKKLDLNRMSPIEAFEMLRKLAEQSRK
ncbi:MAG: DNA mismatch repair protein MutS, partial [Phycisphaerales bacterium]